jgi:bifunctional DNA-binding transcriptional regulator/antitoxin component of YhaV-PrlF toxin-antitoxin module
LALPRLLTLTSRCGILKDVSKSWMDVSFMNQVIHTKLGEGRRVAIPAEMCAEYGLKPGTPVVLESSEAGIVLRPLDAVIGEVQAFFADAAAPNVMLSDELSRDRKAEAKRERRG